MTRRIACLVSILALWLCTSPAQAAAPSHEDAAGAAKEWVSLVDAGKYDESWGQSAAFFRQSVTKLEWNRVATASRAPLGTTKSRELKTMSEGPSRAGGPDEMYLVMQFHTSFANRPYAVETVTVVLEADNRWRVVGYRIK